MTNRIAFAVPAALGVWCLLAAPAAAAAQVTGAASITGIVRDASGGVLPGVTIEASSPVLIEKSRSTVSDAQGQYRIIELRSGVYSVTFTLPGFSVFRRENVELTPNFTATINAELKLGGLEETITVSGGTPLVDVRTITQQKTISTAVLETVPTAKSVLGFAALIPSVVTPPNAQDVGGTKGETSVRMVIHGSKPNDQRLLQDGLRYNGLASDGTGRGYYVNPLAAQEVVIDIGAAGSSEYATSGAFINMISRDGGNRLRGSFFTAWTGAQLQGNNFTDDLRSRGLRSVNETRKVYDVNGMLGGPIVQNRLWFMTAHRAWGRTSRVANLFHDANLDDWVFTPDFARPVDPREYNRAHGVRLTWQAAAAHKITVSYDRQRNVQDQAAGQLDRGNLATEANGSYCQMDDFITGTWTHPATNRLLFEGGVGYNQFGFGNNMSADILLSNFKHCGSDEPDRVSITDTGLGFTYHGNGQKNKAQSNQANGRASMAYVTGSHNFKTGVQFMADVKNLQYNRRTPADTRGLPLAYTFNNGTPTAITQFVSPLLQSQHLRPDLGLFVQDQWTRKRLTVNLGVRYDYIHAYAPAIVAEAGPLTGPRSFDAVDCVPCWHDISPRAAMVYDLFGDGKTALKVGIGRYVAATTIGQATTFSPLNATVNSTTRGWSDTNRNFFPDCDLRNPAINDECGAMANASFGQLQIRTRPDQGWISGWGKRGYNWQTSIGIERELRPGVAVNAGYFRTTFGNFTSTDNVAVTPSDFDQYCIQAPVDPRLPTSGQSLCGFYDITPSKFGIVDNVVTLSKQFGKQTEIYNGVDANVGIRLPNGGMFAGGINVGNSVQTTAVQGGAASSSTSNCFVVDSPQQLRYCDVHVPYQLRLKMNGSYPLPWNLQLAAVFQSLPPLNYGATYTVASDRIAPSLGRSLAGGTRTVTLDLVAPYSQFLDERINQLDVRFTKTLTMGGKKIHGNVDLYNALNASTVVGVNNTFSATWLQPTQILDARLLKLSVQLDF
jgi:hypothetical protein